MANTKSKENTDQTDDLITLTGLNKISTWRFPANLKKCPLFRCKAEFKKRSLAIAHYKAHHASTSVLCFICKKPISVKNNTKNSSCATNYRTHFKRMHPHVKWSLSQQPKVEPSSQSNLKIAPPRSHSVKTQSIAMLGNNIKKICKICGIKFRHLSRHIMETHTKKRILCPLRSCDFTSKRLDAIRRHWKSAHDDIRFPEIAKNSGFTYKTTTAATQERVNYFLSIFSLFNKTVHWLIFLYFL